jgi:hypothetical protein
MASSANSSNHVTLWSIKISVDNLLPTISLTAPIRENIPKLEGYIQGDASIAKGLKGWPVDKLGTYLGGELRWFDEGKTLEEEGVDSGGVIWVRLRILCEPFEGVGEAGEQVNK